jgi:glycosyltransferase involved in cell wall biosynthesis
MSGTFDKRQAMKNSKDLKVFHGFVNYGTQAGFFARGLREKGIKALSVVTYDGFKREIDVELLYGGNIFQKILRHSWNYLKRISWFFEFNTFHFYFGTTLLPGQLDLPFYRLFGKKVIMGYLGAEVHRYQESIEKYGRYTNVQHYIANGVKHDEDIDKRYRHESKYMDLQFVCDPVIGEFVPGSILLPLAIDVSEYQYTRKELGDEIVIMHAPTSRGHKGSKYILAAFDKLLENGYPIKPLLVEGVSHKELKQKYIECDIFVDQILAGWYGTASIEAMALGRPVVCFIRDEYLKDVEYGNQVPVVNATIDNIYEVLVRLIEQKEALPEIGRRSREFIERNHDLSRLTDKLVTYYNQLHEN